MGLGTRSRADINITPLVDVVLVLLIFFMVVVPATQRQIPVEVPPTEDSPPPPLEPPLRVRVEADLGVTIEDAGHTATVRGVDLAVALRPILGRRSDRVVFVDVDPAVTWRDAVGMMDTIRGAGGAVAP